MVGGENDGWMDADDIKIPYLSEEDREEIYELYLDDPVENSFAELSMEYSVSEARIRAIVYLMRNREAMQRKIGVWEEKAHELEIWKAHQTNPEENTIEKLAEDFSLSEKEIRAILKRQNEHAQRLNNVDMQAEEMEDMLAEWEDLGLDETMYGEVPGVQKTWSAGFDKPSFVGDREFAKQEAYMLKKLAEETRAKVTYTETFFNKVEKYNKKHKMKPAEPDPTLYPPLYESDEEEETVGDASEEKELAGAEGKEDAEGKEEVEEKGSEEPKEMEASEEASQVASEEDQSEEETAQEIKLKAAKISAAKEAKEEAGADAADVEPANEEDEEDIEYVDLDKMRYQEGQSIARWKWAFRDLSKGSRERDEPTMIRTRNGNWRQANPLEELGRSWSKKLPHIEVSIHANVNCSVFPSYVKVYMKLQFLTDNTLYRLTHAHTCIHNYI